MNWSERFAGRTRNMKSSAIREILKLTGRGSVISFAGGMPAPGLFPVERLREAADTVLTERGAEALQYGPTEGYAPLREWVAEQLRVAGAGAVTADNVLIVSGSQQALDLVTRIYCDPGDVVVAEAPSYVGALGVFRSYEAEVVHVTMDEHGLVPAELASTLARLDSAPRPSGPMLVAEIDGKILAAVPVDGGRAIADPFAATADLVDLLQARVELFSPQRARVRRPRLRLPRVRVA